MNEVNNKIKYLLETTGDEHFDVGMFINPIIDREEFIIGEFCTLHKGDEFLTTDGKVVTILSVDSCGVTSKWLEWIRSIIGDKCIHFVKARIEYMNVIDWSDMQEVEE